MTQLNIAKVANPAMPMGFTPKITLLAADGLPITSHVDRTSARITHEVIQSPGTHYLLVQDASGEHSGEYRLEVALSGQSLPAVGGTASNPPSEAPTRTSSDSTETKKLSIEKVEPQSPRATAAKQPFIIHGNNFEAGSVVKLIDLDAREEFDRREISKRTGTELQLEVNFSAVPARWRVQVTNPDGSSAQHDFRTVGDDAAGATQTDSRRRPRTQSTGAIGAFKSVVPNATALTFDFLSEVWKDAQGGLDWPAATQGQPADKLLHLGVDIAARTGSPAHPIADGEVYAIEPNHRALGNAVMIRHTSRYKNKVTYSIYLHLSRIDVKLKQPVTTNQAIGLVGATGVGSGSHLHLEVRHFSAWFHPKFLNIYGYKGRAIPDPLEDFVLEDWTDPVVFLEQRASVSD